MKSYLRLPTQLGRVFAVLCAALACYPASAAEHTVTSGNRVFKIYIPDDLPKVRAVFINWKRGGENWGGPETGSSIIWYNQDWRNFFAGLGVANAMIDGPTNQDESALDGGGQHIITALNQLAANPAVGHPELATAPVIMWGHSRTTRFASEFAEWQAARTVGFIQYHGFNNVVTQGLDPAGPVGDVPALLLAGSLDTLTPPQLTIDMIQAGRAQGAPWGGGIEWGLNHGGGNGAVNYARHTIIFPWILSVINKRLPASAGEGGPVTLSPIAENTGWLGNLSTFAIASFPTYSGNAAQASWVADGTLAALWQTYFDNVSVNTSNADGLARRHVLVTARDRQVAEGASGVFTLTRSGDASAALVVGYTVGGTAINGTDYPVLSGSATIPAGARSTNLTVSPFADGVTEGNETVTVTVNASANYFVSEPATATVTILNGGGGTPPTPVATIAATDNSAGEPSNHGQFTVTLSPAPTAATTVTLTRGGTATNGTDYVALPTTVTVGTSGAATVPLTVIDDSLVEGNETVTLTVAAGTGYTVGTPNNATITVTDNDGAGTPTTATFYSIAAQDGSVTESTETSNLGGSSAAGGTGSAALRAGDTATNQQVKAVVSFDTSALPDGATITSVTLRLRRGAVSGTNPFTTHGACLVDVRGGTGFGGALGLANGDFQAAADATAVGQLSDAPANGDWSEGVLGTAAHPWINRTGTTQFRVYFATDDNNDSGRDDLGWFSGESTADNRPQLIVTYTN